MRHLPATAAAVTATAMLGGLASSDTIWFRSLRKPPFQPPDVAFPVVWTGLYASIAAASAQTLDGLPSAAQRRVFATGLGKNLVLNAGWTWCFFRWNRPWLATAESALLAASSADLARRAGQVSRRARRLLLPYMAWTSFATVLSGSIAWLNRHADNR